ncbi:MAG: hypothetical protein KMY53_10240 [Desulfarculus sp.]|nr:hypothetical protein [Pseudomonadota bacterium]MBV1714802.1 hypothetical protein [Desulfarculus sp.]MBU4576516.1 hypothetical protein [Pseudomonadota bacterium]MBU4600343.1 hypothetical protein [Pseudomonadota bacterium]MBV1738531.1 hypothetical protein [Desulfarculus sp.]
MTQQEPNPVQHAQAIYSLSAQIAALLGEALRRDFTFSGTALGQSEVVDQALDGQMQYGLLACALDKIEINQATSPGYWAKLHQELKRLIAREAHASATEILRPLTAVVSDQEMAAIAEAIYNPLGPYEECNLARLQEGLNGTPFEVLAARVVKSFFAKGEEPSAIADRVINLTLEGSRTLFLKGGLA